MKFSAISTKNETSVLSFCFKKLKINSGYLLIWTVPEPICFRAWIWQGDVLYAKDEHFAWLLWLPSWNLKKASNFIEYIWTLHTSYPKSIYAIPSELLYTFHSLRTCTYNQYAMNYPYRITEHVDIFGDKTRFFL